MQLFFALSGFVLALHGEKYLSYSAFLVARFARIWPMHLCGLLLVVAMLYPGGVLYLWRPASYGLLAANLGLLQAWSPDMSVVFSYNAPSWSVSCEAFFYALFIPIYKVMSRRLLRNGLILLAASLSAFAIGSFICTRLHVDDTNWLQYINPIANLPIFILGIFTGIVFRRSMQAPMSFALASVVQVGALGLCLMSGKLRLLPEAAIGWLGIGRLYGGLEMAVFSCLLFYALASTDGIVSRALRLRPIVYLGEISFSIYMIHQTVLVWISVAGPLAGLPIAVQWVIAIALILAGSALSYTLIEKPCRRGIVAAWSGLRSRRGVVSGATP